MIDRGEREMAREKKSTKSELPRKMYTFFAGYADTGVPSFSKFARSIGVTLAELESYRSDSEFERAYRECSEIRRDYLIDNGLTKRFDSSFTKFILSEEYTFGDRDREEGGQMELTLEVIGGKPE